MASPEELSDSLTSFAQLSNDNARLSSMIKDWNRTLHIRPDDLDDSYTLTTKDGYVSAKLGVPDAADLVIQSSSDILTAIFYGELSPNEPYNDGSLRLIGPEDDIVRLDFVIAMLWE